MSGFFSDDEVKNRAADEPWKKSETDKMLDLYFAGAHPKRIAQILGRNPKAIKRRLEQFTYNERDRAVKYEPFRRASRKGKRMTENERVMWDEHRKRHIPAEVTAKVLCRDVSELDGSKIKKKLSNNGLTKLDSMDVVWAHRYAYFGWKQPMISDQEYDDLVQEECEFGGRTLDFNAIKAHRGWPEHIRSLALYLHGKSKEKK